MIDKIIANGFGPPHTSEDGAGWGVASADGYDGSTGWGSGYSSSEGFPQALGNGSGWGLAKGWAKSDGDCFNPGL